jgi:hypothetical protein
MESLKNIRTYHLLEDDVEVVSMFLVNLWIHYVFYSTVYVILVLTCCDTTTSDAAYLTLFGYFRFW